MFKLFHLDVLYNHKAQIDISQLHQSGFLIRMPALAGFSIVTCQISDEIFLPEINTVRDFKLTGRHLEHLCLFLPALFAQQRYEHHRQNVPLFQSGIRPFPFFQHLVPALADRNDQPSAHFQLGGQFFRHCWGCSRNNDAVIGRGFRPAQRPIPRMHEHIFNAKFF